MENLITYPKFRAVDANGNPYASGKLYTYIAGTLTTKATYSDYAKTSPNSNPIILDSNGEALIIPGEGSYRLILKDSNDVEIWDIDNVAGMLGPVVVTLYASESAVQGAAGMLDGEMAIDASTGNIYTWDDGNTKWRVMPNNRYTSDPSDSTYTIENGTQYYNTSTKKLRVYDSGSWTDVISASFTSASTPGAIFSRPVLSYKDGDEVYISAFAIHHQGTTEQIVYSDSQITFQFGPSGSNSDSDTLANNDWFYLYLDDSAIVTAGSASITASEIVALTEEPEWDDARHCWVRPTDNKDRCIGAVYTDGSANVREFYQVSNYTHYIEEITTNISSTDIDTAWGTYVTLVAPKFAQKIRARVDMSSTDKILYWRPYGSSNSTGQPIEWFSPFEDMISDDSQRVDLKASVSSATTFTIYTKGFFLPDGI